MWPTEGKTCNALLHVCTCVSRPNEKQPGNICEFKLLIPPPESWQLQSDFRSRVKAVASCTEMSQSRPFHFNCVFNSALGYTRVGTSHNSFLFEWLLLDFCCTTCSKQLPPRAGKSRSQQLENHMHSSNNHCLNGLGQLPWHYICIQIELVEVARPLFPWPGNKARLIAYNHDSYVPSSFSFSDWGRPFPGRRKSQSWLLGEGHILCMG